MFFLIALLSINLAIIAKAPLSLTSFQKQSNDTYHATFDVDIPQGDALYADYLQFSVDNPHVTISNWQSSIEPVQKYDHSFKSTKTVYNRPFQIQMDAKIDDPTITQANLHVGYYQQSEQKNNHALFTLPLAAPQESEPQDSQIDVLVPVVCEKPAAKQQSISGYLSSLLETTDSLWVKLLLSLLLGIFLSLTPCIYPMIPITMGILQSQASSSVLRNFSLAFTYTMGIATTFAMLGVTAAFTGQMFGNIMNNPIVILTIVFMLIYLAGSMLGLYDMYIPRSLQNSGSNSKGGSYLSAFLFGAASGTIASPCLSPGLVLLLTLVTSIGSVPVGFALLFFFGLGLGMPLLLIGTFSGSLNMLPRAGMWMVDIKQFFGFIMLGTCFYFLSTLVPAAIIAWAVSIFILIVGVFYIRSSNHAYGTRRKVKTILGIVFVAFAIYSFFTAYKTSDIQAAQNCHACWSCDYQQGVCQALQEKKLVLLDISAPYCSICKAIERKHFSDQKVIDAMNAYITIKIDDLEKDESTKAIQQQFHIMGAPTLILFDPATGQQLRRWGGEIYDLTPEQFAAELK